MSDPVNALREIASPPQATACGVSFSEADDTSKARAALYVDGFNLYHAIDNLGEPFLKWLNLWALGERILPRKSQKLVRVVYCTAKKKDDPAKLRRHEEYISALRQYGVEVKLGHFIHDDMGCRQCGHTWRAPSEKESDVNVAISLIDDAHRDIFDHAYLLTADSDQGATARLFKERFPNKTLTSVVPPGQGASKSILSHASGKITITRDYIEDCLLPSILIEEVDGKQTLRFRRPPEYAPPPGWLPPSQRRRSGKDTGSETVTGTNSLSPA